MGQYIIKRLLLMIPTMIGITLITFLIIRLAPGDPVEAKFGAVGEPSASGASGPGGADKTMAIINAKVRLGLLQRGGTARLWNAENGSAVADIVAHGDQLHDLRYSPDGQRIATAGFDGEGSGHLRLWSIKGKRQADLIGSTQAVSGIAFSADGKRLAAVGHDRITRIYELENASGSLEPAFELKGHERVVAAVALSPNGKWLATGSRDKTIRLYDLAASDGDAPEVAQFTEHYQEVTSLVFLDDNTLVSGGRDRNVFAWDLVSGTKTRKLEGVSSEVFALALAKDGAWLAAGLGNSSVCLWSTGDLSSEPRVFSGHTAAVTSLAFHPTQQKLASASKDQTVRIWEIKGDKSQMLHGHSAVVNAVDYHPDGTQLASGALDISKVNLFTSYFQWLGRLMVLDLGRSIKDSRPVKDKILEALPITLTLNLTAILITYLLSIPLGVYAGARRGGPFDQTSSVGLFALYSMPSFWVATMLIILFGSERSFLATEFGFTLPYIGLHDDNASRMPFLQYMLDHGLHLILPLIALTYASFAFLSRLMRTNMLETLSQDFIRTARAKGLTENSVIWKHAFRNSLISIVTVVGNLLPLMIGGSVIIEYIFEIPGMGKLGFDAILQRDYPVIMAITTLTAVLTMVGVLLSDILYSIVDPRIRLS
ncbi:MAG: ABC transporter permease subunit [Planctomycetota bacterium]